MLNSGLDVQVNGTTVTIQNNGTDTGSGTSIGPLNVNLGWIDDLQWQASTSCVLTINQSANGAANNGEVRIQAGKLKLQDGTVRTLSADSRVLTAMEGIGAGVVGIRYILWGNGQAYGTGGRFSTLTSFETASSNAGLFLAYYDFTNSTWKAEDNAGTSVSFTPADDDVMIAILSRPNNTTAGIASIRLISTQVADPEADVTGLNTALNVTNQGDLATKDSVDLSTSDVTGTLSTTNAAAGLVNANVTAFDVGALEYRAPVANETARLALTDLGAGTAVYQTDTKVIWVYNGSAWVTFATHNTGALANKDSVDLSSEVTGTLSTTNAASGLVNSNVTVATIGGLEYRAPVANATALANLSPAPITGTAVYQTDIKVLWVYNGSAWVTYASYGAQAGTSLTDSTGTVLGDTDVVTSQGTANDTTNVNGVAASTVESNADTGAALTTDSSTVLHISSVENVELNSFTLGNIKVKDGYIHTNQKTTFASAADVEKGLYIGSNGQFAISDGVENIFEFDPTIASPVLAIKGAITADSGSFTGEVNAESGTFAGSVNVTNNGKMYGGTMSSFNSGQGFFLGYDTDAYKFSVGNASSKVLTWDGDNLNVEANLVSFTTGNEQVYSSLSRLPPGVVSAARSLGSNSDYFYFDSDLDVIKASFVVSYNLGALTSGSISGQTNSRNAILSTIKLELFYATASYSGTPGTWISWDDSTFTTSTLSPSEASMSDNTLVVQQVDLGGGNWETKLLTREEYRNYANDDYYSPSFTPNHVVDDEYYLNWRVAKSPDVEWPAGAVFIKVVATVTNGSYTPYPSTGSPSVTETRIVSIPGATLYQHENHGPALALGGQGWDNATRYAGLNGQTVLSGGEVIIGSPRQNIGSVGKTAKLKLVGFDTDNGSIRKLSAIEFHNGLSTLNGSPEFQIYVPNAGDALRFAGDVNFNSDVDVDGTLSINGVTVNAGAVTGPAGSNTQVQFNNNGALGASSDFTFNDSTDTLTVKNLTVSGTTTTVNTDNLTVKDNNITLNYSTGDSSSTADDAGITIQDAVDATNDASILWKTASDTFEFSHGVVTPTLVSGDIDIGDGTAREELKIKSNSYAEIHYFIKHADNSNVLTEYIRAGVALTESTYNQTIGDYFLYSPQSNKMILTVPQNGDPLKRNNGAITIIDSTNYGTYALPLTGGTLTGALSGTAGTFTGAVSGSSFELSGISVIDSSQNINAASISTSGITSSGDITLTSTATSSPSVNFNSSTATDPAVDMAIKLVGEELHFYEPEDTSKVHFKILDDTGVDAPFGYWVNGTRMADANRNLTVGTISSGAITATSNLFLRSAGGEAGIYLQDSSASNATAFKIYADVTLATSTLYIDHDPSVLGGNWAFVNGGNFLASGTIYADGAASNSLQWEAGYDYSQVGHLPLAGGTLTGSLSGTSANFSGIVYAGTRVEINGGAAWAYTRLTDSGGVKWDIAANANDNSSALQFRPFGSGTNATLMSTGGNWTIAGTVSSAGFKSNGVTVIDSNRQIFAKTGTQVGEDGTYGGYGVIGFGGITNGYNRVFGNDGTDDGLFLAAATGRGVFVRTNGANSDTFSFTSAGAFKVGVTTVLDSSRNLTAANGNFSGIVGVNKATNSAVGLSVGSDASTATSYGLEVCNSTSNTRFIVDGLGNSTFYQSDNSVGMSVTSGGNVDINSGALKMGGTTVISSGRNLANIGSYTGSGQILITGPSIPIKVTGTSASAYAEVQVYNDNGAGLIMGSIGSTYSNAAFAGSRYIYSTSGEFRIKSAGALKLYSGGTGDTANLAVTFDTSRNATFTGTISSGAITSTGLTVSNAGSNSFLKSEETTGAARLQLTNTGANVLLGADNSTGGLTGVANQAYIYSANTLKIGVNTFSTQQLTVNSTGILVNGTITSNGDAYIGERLFFGVTGTSSFIGRESTVNLGLYADGAHKFYTWTTAWTEQATIDDSGLTVLGQITVTNDDHNYLKIESAIAKEQMVRFKNSLANYWYAGLRTSNGLATTADFHIYSTAYGNDVLALKTDGSMVVAGSVNGVNLAPSASGSRWGVTAEVASNGVMEVGRYIDFSCN